MPAGLVIDDRESALIQELSRKHTHVPVSTARLTVGDIHVVAGTATLMVLERKTRADLRASLIDGRFVAQRSRMMAAFGRARVAYIIEGGSRWDEPESGAELALVVRDGVSVFWSSSMADTACLVARLVHADLNERVVPPEAPPGSDASGRVANANAMSAERSLAAMLRCVPGVSARKAALIATHYTSMSTLLKSMSEDCQAAVQEISEMRDRAGGNRFGAVLAERVVACLGDTTASTRQKQPRQRRKSRDAPESEATQHQQPPQKALKRGVSAFSDDS